MALAVGQCRTDAPAPSGISARMWAGLSDRSAWAGMVSSLAEGTTARDAIAAVLEAVAQGVFNVLITDVTIKVTVPADAFGPGIPAADVELTATVS